MTPPHGREVTVLEDDRNPLLGEHLGDPRAHEAGAQDAHVSTAGRPGDLPGAGLDLVLWRRRSRSGSWRSRRRPAPEGARFEVQGAAKRELHPLADDVDRDQRRRVVAAGFSSPRPGPCPRRACRREASSKGSRRPGKRGFCFFLLAAVRTAARPRSAGRGVAGVVHQPQAPGLAASTCWPVRIRSRASGTPIRRGRRCVPPNRGSGRAGPRGGRASSSGARSLPGACRRAPSSRPPPKPRRG